MEIKKIQGLDDNFLLECLNGSVNYYDKTNPYLKRLESIIEKYQANNSGEIIEIDKRKEMEKELMEASKQYTIAVDDKNRVQTNFENELKDLFGVNDISKVRQEWIDVILKNGNLQNDTDFETEEEFDALLKASNNITPERIRKLKNMSYTIGYCVEKERKATAEMRAKRQEFDTYFQYHKNEVKTYDVDEIATRATELIDRFRNVVSKHDEQIEGLIVEQTENIETLRQGYQSLVESGEDVKKLASDVYEGDINKVDAIETENSNQQYRFRHAFYDWHNTKGTGYTFGAYENAVDIKGLVTWISESFEKGDLENVVENLDAIERKVNKMEMLDREIDRRVEQTTEETKLISSMLDKQIEENSTHQDKIVKEANQIHEQEFAQEQVKQQEIEQPNPNQATSEQLEQAQVEQQVHIEQVDEEKGVPENSVLVEEIGKESEYKVEQLDQTSQTIEKVEIKPIKQADIIEHVNMARRLSDRVSRWQTWVGKMAKWVREFGGELYGNYDLEERIPQRATETASEVIDTLHKLDKSIETNYQGISNLIEQINQKYDKYQQSAENLQQELDSKEYIASTLDRYEEILNIDENVRNGKISSSTAERMMMRVAERQQTKNETTTFAKDSLNHKGINSALQGVLFSEREDYRTTSKNEEIIPDKEVIQSCKVESENVLQKNIQQESQQYAQLINETIDEFNQITNKQEMDSYNEQIEIISTQIDDFIDNYGSPSKKTANFDAATCYTSLATIESCNEELRRLTRGVDYSKAEDMARKILTQLDNAIEENKKLIQQSAIDTSLFERVESLAQRTQDLGKNNPELDDCLRGCLKEARDSFGRNNPDLDRKQWPAEFKDGLRSALNGVNSMRDNMQIKNDDYQKNI